MGVVTPQVAEGWGVGTGHQQGRHLCPTGQLVGFIKLPCNIQDVLGAFVQQQGGQTDAQVLSSQLGLSGNVAGSDAHQLWIILRAIFMLGREEGLGLVRRKGKLRQRRAPLQPWHLDRDVDGGLHGVLHGLCAIQTPDSSGQVQLGRKVAASVDCRDYLETCALHAGGYTGETPEPLPCPPTHLPLLTCPSLIAVCTATGTLQPPSSNKFSLLAEDPYHHPVTRAHRDTQTPAKDITENEAGAQTCPVHS